MRKIVSSYTLKVSLEEESILVSEHRDADGDITLHVYYGHNNQGYVYLSEKDTRELIEALSETLK